MSTSTTDSNYRVTVDTVARDLLARRAGTGVCLNGASHDAVAGASGFQAVTPSEVARLVQDDAQRRGRRWKNSNHRTVEDALVSEGWYRIYTGRKGFMLRDRAERDRMQALVDERDAAERAKAAERLAESKALRAVGPTTCIRVWYAKPKNSYRFGSNEPRRFEVPAANVLDEALHLSRGKAVRIEVGAAWGEQSWSWRREAWRREA